MKSVPLALHKAASIGGGHKVVSVWPHCGNGRRVRRGAVNVPQAFRYAEAAHGEGGELKEDVKELNYRDDGDPDPETQLTAQVGHQLSESGREDEEGSYH